ncbi:MAG: glutaredoxin family protein [Burkholderiales bacterium]|nr:glutaredoxin family protein [Burkholderiales bacterium]
MTTAIPLVLYGREYCGLCRQMQEELRLLAPDIGIEVSWFDIDDDDATEAKYSDMVPVLVGEADEVICFYHLNRRALDAYLRRFR